MSVKEDLLSLAPPRDFTRRDFIVTVLATGFAAAVRPIAAQTVIQTDSKGLIAGEVKIPVKDGQVPAYRAMPEKGKNFATVLVVQEIFGVHEHIRDVCRRLAKLGYLAVAPELFARQGDVSKMTDIKEILEKVVPRVPDAQVMGDLDATAAWAAQNNGNGAKLGITGFCWGGRIVWLYAAHNPGLKAGVAWYGRLTGDKDELRPRQPLDLAASIKAPVLGLYGAEDQGIPVEIVEMMQDDLKAAKNPSEIVIYPDAPDGFHADFRSSYRQGTGAGRLEAPAAMVQEARRGVTAPAHDPVAPENSSDYSPSARRFGDDRLHHDLHTPVEATSFFVGIGRARRVFTLPHGHQPLRNHALATQVVRHRAGTPFRQCLVVLVGTDIVGMADDGQVGLAIAHQHVGDLVHGALETRLDRRRIEIKRGLRRHGDQQVVLTHRAILIAPDWTSGASTFSRSFFCESM